MYKKLSYGWLLLGMLLLSTTVSASPTRADDVVIDPLDHYELREKISRDSTRIDFNFDQSVVDHVDSHGKTKYREESHDVFEQTLVPVSGGNQPTTNNNALFGQGLANFTYTHFLRNPGLSPEHRAEIKAFRRDSLIEFALKLGFHDLDDDSRFSIWALPVIPATATSLALALDEKGKDLEIHFNLFDDFGNSATIDSLNALGAIFAASADGGIQINISNSSSSSHSQNFELESSELELEFVIPEPPTWLLLLVGSLLLMLSRRYYYRDNNGRR